MKSEDRSKGARSGARRPLVWADLRGSETDLRARWRASVDVSVEGALYTEAKGSPALAPLLRQCRAADRSDWALWQSLSAEAWLNARKRAALGEGSAERPLVEHWGGVWFEKDRRDLLDLDWDRWDEGLSLHKVGFRPGMKAPELAEHLYRCAAVGPEQWRRREGCWGHDPLGCLLRSGAVEGTPTSIEQRVGEFFDWSLRATPTMKALLVSADLLHEAGASAAEQIGFAMAMALEYLRWAEKAGIPLSDAASRIQLNLGVGGPIFPEIAKVRACRLLWSRVLEACGIDATRSFIHARVVDYNKTLREPLMNLPRTTFDAFAAIVGGVDSLETSAHTLMRGGMQDAGDELAAKVQWILEQECRLAKVMDPGGGSWAVEALTRECASEAWSVFQEVEAEEGAFDWILRGRIQARIRASLERTHREVAEHERRLVGISLQPDPKQVPRCVQLEREVLEPKEVPEGTGLSVRRLERRRLSRPFEEICCDVLRWKNKKGFFPRVLLCTLIGSDGVERSDLLAEEVCREAGFDLVAGEFADSADKVIRRFAEVAPEGVMVRATGGTLAEFGSDVVRRLNSGGAKFVIISVSESQDLFRLGEEGAGDTGYLALYPGCNVLEVLHEALIRLGIRR